MSGVGDDNVGYARPPKSTQFKKGASGNPRGRPRKAKPPQQEALHPANHPTRNLLRAESARLITVRDGDTTAEIPTTQAVLRSMAIQAAKGGPLAQRTWLHYQLGEDERYRREQKEIFEFWQGRREASREKIDNAVRNGSAIPDPLPHPDDIQLNYLTFEVKITGPMDAEGKAHQDRLIAMRDQFYALAIYNGEFDPRRKVPERAIGFYTWLSALFEACLPPRLRWGDGYEPRMWKMLNMRRRDLEAELIRLSALSQHPFEREAPSKSSPSWIPVAKLAELIKSLDRRRSRPDATR